MAVEEEISRAFSLLAKGLFSDAELLLEVLHAKDPSNCDVVLGLATLRMHCADYEKALDLLLRAAEMRPEIGRIHLLIALALAKLHRPREAQEFLATARELDASDERIPRVEAAILMEEGKLEQALELLTTYALDNPEGSWDVWNDLGTLYYQLEQYERAQESFRRAIDVAQTMGLDVPFVHFNLGLCHNAVGDYDAAKDEFSAALALDSSFAPAWAALGLLIAADGDYERAADFVGRAIDIDPDTPAHWYAMGQVMEFAGDKQAAKHYFTEGYKALRRQRPELFGDGPKG